MTSKTRLSVYFVLFTVMLDAIGFGLIMPVMPELMLDLGTSDLSQAALWGGILSSVYAIMQFLFGPLVGNLSDRFGRRPVLLVSLFAMCLDYILMGLASAMWMLFLGRVIGGITAANHATASAVIADVSKPEEKAANFGLLGAAFGVGFILGPLLGGLLAELGPRAPFFGAAILAGGNMVFGYFVLAETVPVEKRRPFQWSRAHPFGAFKSVGRLPGQARMLIVVMLYELAFIVYPTVWAYFTIEKFDWDAKMVGISLACFGFLMAVVQGGLIRMVVPRLGEHRTALVGFFFNAVAFFFYAAVPQGWMIFALMPITALGALASPAIQGIMSRAVPDDAQGELQGVVSSIRAFSMIAGPLVMTGLFSWFTYKEAPIYFPGAPFMMAMALMLLTCVVFLGRTRLTVKR